MATFAHRIKPLKYALKSFALARAPAAYWAVRELLAGPLEAEITMLRAFADPERIALDVGANFGAWAFALSRTFRHCHAFEPQPQLADVLRRGLGERVSVHQVAVSNRSGMARLRVPRRWIGRSTIEAGNALADIADEPTRELDVVTTRLDDLGLADEVGFVKIDVEGHELEVLEGARALIAASRPTVLVETEDRHRAGAPDAVRAYFAGLPYEAIALGRNFLFVPRAS